MDSAADVVLHIGLHKTGTRYLQRMVLGQLDAERFAVNPEAIHRPLRRVMRDRQNGTALRQAQDAIAAWKQSDPRTLVISEPHICGDMFSGYDDYGENLQLIRRLFPEARILYVVRNQADWLHSAYRQHLARGRPVPIETFLNFFDGRFHSRPARSVNGVRNMEALSLPFLDIYRAYADAYGAERVYMLRQEDLKRDRERFQARLAECLGVERLPDPPTQRSQNRSYSALAIGLFHPSTLRRAKPLMPRRRGILSLARESRVGRSLRRLRRAFIQHVFDRMIYMDWDLLKRSGMREQIDRYYLTELQEIDRIARRILENGPEGSRTARSGQAPIERTQS